MRYCARPAFALERLAVIGGRDARLADMVPPRRKHRHRYHGVFAPNHPLRPLVTALAIGNVGKAVGKATGQLGQSGPPAGGVDTEPQKRSHDTSRLAWAKLLARIAEAFPLVCPACGGDIRLIAFGAQFDQRPAGAGSLRTGGSHACEGQDGFASVKQILAHVGEPVEPPPVSPARGPPTEWHELVQAHDDRDLMQASPDELPMIDIHSL